MGNQLYWIQPKPAGRLEKNCLPCFLQSNGGNLRSPVHLPHQAIFRGKYSIPQRVNHSLTETRSGDLYFCLEQRLVTIREQPIELTVKEFEIFSLLILNPKRVFTYEMLMDLVWHEDYTYYSRKAVNNHVSNLRKKLKITPDGLEYIKNIVGVGYKFEIP